MEEMQPVAAFIAQSDEFMQGRSTFYTALEPTKREIRLMHILPGEHQDPIHITLHKVDLADEPFYETISYTWEAMSPTKRVYIHNVGYDVTINQFAALRRLRLPGDTKVMWMDVVCIDQANLQERAHQVGIMGDIYANAACTDVWLGELSESWQRPMSDGQWDQLVEGFHENKEKTAFWKTVPSAFRQELMTRFLQTRSFIERVEFVLYQLAADIHIGDLPYCTFDGQNLILCRPWYDAINAVLQIFRRPWWTRVWVLQEVLLCRGDPQVLFGPHVLPFSLFTKGVGRFANHFYVDRCCFDTALPSVYSFEFVERLTNLNSINVIRTNFTPGNMPIHKATELTKGRTVTDIRDHIYGILGLVDSKDRAKVDYTSTTGQVFASNSWHLFKARNTLTWLTQGGLPGGPRTPEIPTWSVDWINVNSSITALNDSWPIDEHIDWTRTQYNENLKLVANHVAGIRLVLTRARVNNMRPQSLEHYTLLWSWSKGLEDAGLEPGTETWTMDQYRNNDFFFEFFATIFRDTTCPRLGYDEKGSISIVESHRRLADKDWHNIARWWNLLDRCVKGGTEQTYPGSDLISTVSAFDNNSLDSTLALTTENQLCLVPQTSKAGDSLYHIRACCPPMVLRKGAGDKFQVVGPAYLRGAMGSEGWRREEERVIVLK